MHILYFIRFSFVCLYVCLGSLSDTSQESQTQHSQSDLRDSQFNPSCNTGFSEPGAIILVTLDGRLHTFSVSLLSSCTSKSITSSNHFRFKERFVKLESLLHLCHHSSGSNSYYSSSGQLRQLPQLLFVTAVFTFSRALSLAREFFLKHNLYSIIAQHKACQEFTII